jgi:hypothetical protein
MTGVFHIRGSKLNGSDRPMTSLTKSVWAGLRTKFRSAGITADGTEFSGIASGPTDQFPNLRTNQTLTT